MNQPSPQFELLKAATHDLRLGHHAKAVGHLLDLYEAGYLSDKLGELLSLLPDDLTQTPPSLLPRLEALIAAHDPAPKVSVFGLMDFDFERQIEASLEQWSSAEAGEGTGGGGGEVEEEFLLTDPIPPTAAQDAPDGSMPWFVSTDIEATAALPLIERSEGSETVEYGLDPFLSEPQHDDPPPQAQAPFARPRLEFEFSFDDDPIQPSALDKTTESGVTLAKAVAGTTQENGDAGDLKELLSAERALGQSHLPPPLASTEDPVTREVTGIEDFLDSSMDDLFSFGDEEKENVPTSAVSPPAHVSPTPRPAFDFGFSFGEDSDPSPPQPPSHRAPTLPKLPAVQESEAFYNPFELSESSGSIPENWDQESWGEPVEIMPGLSEDWLDQGEAPPMPPQEAGMHADVTAIPGLNTSGAKALFDVAYGHNNARPESSAPGLRYAPSHAESSPPSKSTPGRLGALEQDEPDYDMELLDAFTFEAPPRGRLPLSPPLEHAQSSPPPHSTGDEVSEDEFFELADSLAAEHSSASSETSGTYRGEPIVRREHPTTEMPAIGRVADAMAPRGATSPFQDLTHRPPHNPFAPPGATSPFKPNEPANPFAHSEATGIQSVALERGPSSFVTDTPESAADGKDLLEQFDEQLAHHHFAQAQTILAEMSLAFGEPSQEVSEARARITRAQDAAQMNVLGDLNKIPVLKLSIDQLSSHALDHKAGFLLSQIDGTISLQDLLEISGMPRQVALEALVELVELGVVALT